MEERIVETTVARAMEARYQEMGYFTVRYRMAPGDVPLAVMGKRITGVGDDKPLDTRADYGYPSAP